MQSACIWIRFKLSRRKSSSTFISKIRKVLTQRVHSECIPLQGTQVLCSTSCRAVITNTEAIKSMQGYVCLCMSVCGHAWACACVQTFLFHFIISFSLSLCWVFMQIGAIGVCEYWLSMHVWVSARDWVRSRQSEKYQMTDGNTSKAEIWKREIWFT